MITVFAAKAPPQDASERPHRCQLCGDYNEIIAVGAHDGHCYKLDRAVLFCLPCLDKLRKVEVIK